jgi:putative transposase
MRDYKNLAHTRWDCKYHIVFISKKRRKIIFGTLRKHLGETFHELAARNFKGKQKNFAGEAFWARGYFVSTVGLNEEMVREYIRNQEKNDVDTEQLKFGI